MTDPGDFSWVRLLLAFSVVLALLWLLAFALKYIGTRGLTLPNRPLRARRMQIVETLPVDTRRRFAIVRCDGREHLLLFSAQGDIVVEANLQSPAPPPALPEKPLQAG
jgi:flagellar protein FliO/FliZ